MSEIPIGDPRPAGAAGPAGDQRAAGEAGPAGDPRPGGQAALTPEADAPTVATAPAKEPAGRAAKKS